MFGEGAISASLSTCIDEVNCPVRRKLAEDGQPLLLWRRQHRQNPRYYCRPFAQSPDGLASGVGRNANRIILSYVARLAVRD